MAYSSYAVANKFLELAANEDKKVTPMKLLKLVYIAHGFYLALSNEPLISESIQAWRFGPVIPHLYHEFKMFGNQPIRSFSRQAFDQEELEQDELTLKFIKIIWKSYKDYTGIQLSNLTHEKGTPWRKVWESEKGDSYSKLLIPTNTIKNYYKEKLEKRAA